MLPNVKQGTFLKYLRTHHVEGHEEFKSKGQSTEQPCFSQVRESPQRKPESQKAAAIMAKKTLSLMMSPSRSLEMSDFTA